MVVGVLGKAEWSGSVLDGLEDDPALFSPPADRFPRGSRLPGGGDEWERATDGIRTRDILDHNQVLYP